MIKYNIVIPARYASTRLPGKPLQMIGDRSMIQRVYEAALKSAADEIIIATDDSRIAAEVERFGGQYCLTRDDHPSGTDRLCEVADSRGWHDDEVIVNLQGDEPLMPAAVLDQVANNLVQHRCDAATLCEAIDSQADFDNPNIVKVVLNQKNHALYFSRAPIPLNRDNDSRLNERGVLGYRHIGLYAYSAKTLRRFVSLAPSRLESLEKLEQLRLLDNGLSMHVSLSCQQVPGGIDTAEDLAWVREYFEEQGRQ